MYRDVKFHACLMNVTNDVQCDLASQHDNIKEHKVYTC